jgi:hypothetical protein
MRVSLPRVRCLEDKPSRSDLSTTDKSPRQHAFVFAPPPYGPQQIGIVFSRYDWYGNPVTKPVIVNLAYQPADRVLERGELLIVTGDNLRLLHFIEDSGMFRRAR